MATIDFPADLKVQWGDVVRDLFSVVRRCQGMGRRQKGLAAVRLLIFVNEDGCPVAWTEPKMTLLEPMNRVEPDTIKALIAQCEEAGVDLADMLAKS